MKLGSRLAMVFCRNLCAKGQIWVSQPYFWKLGVTHDFDWWLIGKPMVDFLFVSIDFFRYLLRFRSFEAKCVQLGCFRRGVDLFALNCTWTGSSPATILGIRKLEMGYLKDWWWRSHPSAFPRFDTIPECDRRTDRQTEGRICRSIYSACKASCKNQTVII